MTQKLSPTSITVDPLNTGQRLDVFLHVLLGRSRSYWQNQIKADRIKINHRIAKPSSLLETGDQIRVELPEALHKQTILPPQLPILYEDKYFLVVNKPPGLLTHPAPNSTGPTVADFAATKFLPADTLDDRPGIVHRLDKDTSGLLIIAKTPTTKAFLQRQFKARLVKKTYLLLVQGTPEHDSATLNLPLTRHRSGSLKRVVSLNGKPAVTDYQVIASFRGYSLLEARPTTGRTHQLRAHFAHLGHPVAGDIVYGPPTRPSGLKRQFLHAIALEFKGPDGKLHLINSPLPADLKFFLDQIKPT